MKNSARTLGGSITALLAATALALSVAVPASAVTSTGNVNQICGGPLDAKYTVTATGSWYTQQRAYPVVASYNGALFFTGGTRTFWGNWQSIQWIAGQNIPPGNISSYSSTCA